MFNSKIDFDEEDANEASPDRFDERQENRNIELYTMKQKKPKKKAKKSKGKKKRELGEASVLGGREFGNMS